MKFFITGLSILLIVLSIRIDILEKKSKIQQKPQKPLCEVMADSNYVVLTLSEYKKMDSVVAIVLNK